MSAIFSALVFAMFEILLSILGFGMDRIGMKVDGKSGKKRDSLMIWKPLLRYLIFSFVNKARQRF